MARILLAEDDEDMRRVLARALENAGYQVVSFNNGRDAYERLRAVVVDELVDTPEHSLHLPEPRDDRLRTVTDLLYDDPAHTATLGELGRIAGTSERTLSRLFHDEFGMSFHRWRTILRIHHALIHLTDGRSVTDTALACGWSNPTSFIDAFTTVVGQTPGRYKADLGDATR